jgi:CHAT domain-containing protein
MLVAPAKELLPHASHVIVVPDGCLNRLNLETLLMPDGKYWIEDATIQIAPSLRLLGQRSSHDVAADKDSILLIGDPTPDPSLPNLLFASQEIASIAALYPKPEKLTAGQARPEAYRAANPSRFSLIHFAAHALPNRDSPLDSSIVLSHGRLYAREVEGVPLSDALVTISACESAGAKTYTGEGLVGFAWAFLRAGARGVIASLWDVNDRSTAEFMRALYTRFRQNESPGEALRTVKLEFIHSHDSRQKPYSWAPFQIYVR